MRHAFISTLAERDVQERTAQHLAGHEDGRMTHEIYTHVTRIMLNRANAIIEGAVGDITRRVGGSLDGSPEPDDGLETKMLARRALTSTYIEWAIEDLNL